MEQQVLLHRIPGTLVPSLSYLGSEGTSRLRPAGNLTSWVVVSAEQVGIPWGWLEPRAIRSILGTMQALEFS
jgi:hypothetical protein